MVAIKSIELTDDTTQELFDAMFSSTERNLLPEEDIELSKKLIRNISMSKLELIFYQKKM